MAQFNSYEQKGKVQSLSRVVTMISPEETPFMTAIGKVGVGNTLFNWTEDAIRDPTVNAAVEGADAGEANGAPLIEKSNYTQIFADTVNVSGSAAATETAGKREVARQVNNTLAAVKKDVEFAYIGTGQAGGAGTSSTARTTASYQAQIAADNIIDKSSAAVTEDDIADIQTQLYTVGGKADIIHVSPAGKRALSKALLDSKVQYINDTKTVHKGVSFYMGDFGTYEVHPNRQVRYDAATGVGDILVFDVEMWEEAVLRERDFHIEDLAKTGDSVKKQILTERGLKNRNENASGLLTNVLFKAPTP